MTKFEFKALMNKPVTTTKRSRIIVYSIIILFCLALCFTMLLLMKNANIDAFSTYGPYNVEPNKSAHFSFDNADIRYSSSDTLQITDYVGEFKELVFPSEINGKAVTQISRFVDLGDDKVKKVYIPYGIKFIGNMAFYNCSNLKSVFVPQSVEKIGGWTFDGVSKDFCIYGYEGSYAEEYAKTNNLKFEAIT